VKEKSSTSVVPLIWVFLALNTAALAQTNIETNVVSDAAATNALSPASAEMPKNVFDTWHHNICLDIVGAVRRFDRFFQDPSLKEENNDTRISIGVGISWSRKDRASFANETSARIALPNLQNRLQVIEDNMIEGQDPGALHNVVTAAKESRPDTGLRYIFSDNSRFRFSADGGVRVGNPSEVFGKLRGRYTVPFENWEERFTQTVQWYSLDGWSESSTMRWSRVLKNNWLFQAESDITWDEVRSAITPSQVFSLSKQPTRTQGFQWTVSGVWPSTPSSREAVYAIEGSYRWLIHGNWLYVELRPGLDFQQVDRFVTNPKITFLLNTVFSAED
jgi:hypothetical protein